MPLRPPRPVDVVLAFVPKGERFLSGRCKTLLERLGLCKQGDDKVVELDQPRREGTGDLHGKLERRGIFAVKQVLKRGLVHGEHPERRHSAGSGAPGQVEQQADFAEHLARPERGDCMVNAIRVSPQHFDTPLDQNHHPRPKGALLQDDRAPLPILEASHVHQPPEFIVRQGTKQGQRAKELDHLSRHCRFRPRTFNLIALSLASASSFASCSVPTLDAPPVNVLLVTVHGLSGAGLGTVPSGLPGLENVAQEGLTYERAWASAPSALPSLATILTGEEPARHGLRGPGLALDPTVATLAERLSDAGWWTRAIATDLPGQDWYGLDRGFHTATVVQNSDQALELALRPTGRPTWTWVHVGGDVAEDVDQRAAQLIRRWRATFSGSAAVLVGDRGKHTASTGPWALTADTLHVPLMVWAAGVTPGRREGMASQTDVAPTILVIAGLEPTTAGQDLRGSGTAVVRSETAGPCSVGEAPRIAIVDVDGGTTFVGDRLEAWGPDGSARPATPTDASRTWVATSSDAKSQIPAAVDPTRLLAAVGDGEWPILPGACNERSLSSSDRSAWHVEQAAALGLDREAARRVAALASDLEGPAVPLAELLLASVGLPIRPSATPDAFSAVARFLAAERSGDSLSAFQAASEVADLTGDPHWRLEAALAVTDRAALETLAWRPDLERGPSSRLALAALCLFDGDPLTALAALDGVEVQEAFWTWTLRGSAAWMLGDDRAATEAWVTATAAAPYRRGPRRALAETWLRVDRPENALRALAPVDGYSKDPAWLYTRRRVHNAVAAAAATDKWWAERNR